MLNDMKIHQNINSGNLEKREREGWRSWGPIELCNTGPEEVKVTRVIRDEVGDEVRPQEPL